MRIETIFQIEVKVGLGRDNDPFRKAYEYYKKEGDNWVYLFSRDPYKEELEINK